MLAFVALLVVLFGVMATNMPRALTHLKSYAQAQRHVKAKEYLYAGEKYEGVLQEYSGSVRLALKAGDAEVVATVLKNPDVSLLGKVLAAPAVGLIYLGAIGSVVWLDLGYALLAAAMPPNIIQLFL